MYVYVILAIITVLHAKIRTLNFMFSIDSNSVKEDLSCSYLIHPPLSRPSAPTLIHPSSSSLPSSPLISLSSPPSPPPSPPPPHSSF